MLADSTLMCTLASQQIYSSYFNTQHRTKLSTKETSSVFRPGSALHCGGNCQRGEWCSL